MIGLFDLVWPEVCVALADIQGIGPTIAPRTDQAYRELRIRGAEARRVSPRDVDRLMQRPVQLLPVAGECAVLRTWTHDGVCEVGRTPVIGWALCMDGEVRVVTPQGVNDGRSDDVDIYVAMPDGSVQSVGRYCDRIFFDGVDEYLRYQAEQVPGAEQSSGAAA